MKVTINRKALREALRQLRTLIKTPARLTLPMERTLQVTTRVRATATGDREYLELRGFNLGRWCAGISVELDTVKTTTPGRALIGLAELEAAVKSQSDDELELERGDLKLGTSEHRPFLVLRSSTSAIALAEMTAGQDVAEQYEKWTATVPEKGGIDTRISRNRLAQVFAGPISCASDEISRPILNGVCLKRTGVGLAAICGTNGHRLYLVETADLSVPEQQELIVPPDLIKAALSIWREPGTPLRFYASPSDREPLPRTKVPPKEGQPGEAQPPQIEREVLTRARPRIRIDGPGASISCDAIEGPYPAYEQVLPKNLPSSEASVVYFEKQAALERLRQIAPAANDNTYRTAVRIEEKRIVLACSSFEAAATSSIECEREGNPIVFGLNLTYISALLRLLPTPRVRLQATTPERAIRLEPQITETDAPQDLHYALVMPLRLLDDGPGHDAEVYALASSTPIAPLEPIAAGPSADASFGG
ncbi:MAG TPA: hypothetical protein VD838_05875 [Anaeromyxobacteraceae bacterium]|nr:hypothetical protein [Anaeromyxobacteraceae bacterium]